MALEIFSPDFEDNGLIPKRFTCEGEDVNPTLLIEGVDEDTVTLAIIVDDPDAPGGDFVHWVVWNIDAHTNVIESGILPEDSVEGVNDFGVNEYRGPCPPSGKHRYQFKVFALDDELELEEDAGKEELEKAMAGHILDEAMIVGLYEKGS